MFDEFQRGSGKQSVATTMAFVRILKDLMKDPVIGERFVPIIPDEARTFGMDSLFPTAKIYSPFGQTYEAVDRNLMLSYKESERGQLLHEGISEAGAMGSVIAAGSAYATHGTHMIPVYVFYSMFGWQRTGDAMWALGDQLGRGFLLGATAGRTTLTGEGLQHNDGHSQLLASVSPACVSYDPAWAYEIAVITKDALRRMYDSTPEHPDGEDIFYYLTVYNEPYPQPPAPAVEGLEEGILRGMYRYAAVTLATARRRHAAGAGARLRRGDAVGAERAAAARRGLGGRRGRLVGHLVDRAAARRPGGRVAQPAAPRGQVRVPYVTTALAEAPGPVVAVSDWMRAVPDQIARWVPSAAYTSLGTDGFGFSDTRPAARRFFHVDAESIVLAVLSQLVKTGAVDPSLPAQAIEKYKLNLPVSEALG